MYEATCSAVRNLSIGQRKATSSTAVISPIPGIEVSLCRPPSGFRGAQGSPVGRALRSQRSRSRPSRSPPGFGSLRVHGRPTATERVLLESVAPPRVPRNRIIKRALPSWGWLGRGRVDDGPALSPLMFQKVDCIRLRVPDLDEGLRFYCERLGHELRWRRGAVEAGLRMPLSDTELVLFTDQASDSAGAPEVDLLVDSTDESVVRFRDLGGRVVTGPFDIPVGRCAVVVDPFGNQFVMLDLSKGLLKTDKDRNVVE